MDETKKIFGISIAHWLTCIPFFDTSDRNALWKELIWQEQHKRANEQLAKSMGLIK